MNEKRKLIYADDLLAQFPVGGGVTAARARRAIEKAETVDAEPVRRGKWVQDDTWRDLYFCSVCLTRDHCIPKHKYCPECGARMDEVDT